MSVTNGFFAINGIVLPYPKVGLNVARQQLVDSKRNALGEVVAQTVNRRIAKWDNVEWAKLTAAQWRVIQNEINKFKGTLTVWDNPSGKFKNISVYWGDESAEVSKINPATGEHLEYQHCKCNIIDMGFADE